MLRPGDGNLLAQILNGSPTYLGTIDITGTSKTNHQATTPFNNTGDALAGKVLLIQTTVDCYVAVVSTNTGTTAAATGVKLVADERIIITMPRDASWLAAIRVTSNGDVKVWELN